MSTENTYSWLASYPPDVDWEAPLVRGPVHALLDNTVAAYGDRPGVDFMGKKWTWGEVGAAVDALAAGLQARGLQKGARVGLFLPNSFEYLVSYYAVLKAGGIVVNFNPLYAPRELEFQVRDSGISTMITFDLAALFDKVKPLLGQAQLETVIVCRFADSLPFPKSLLFPLLKKKDQARAGRHRSGQRHRRASIYGRYHRHAQGRNVDSRQCQRQRAPERAVVR